MKDGGGEQAAPEAKPPTKLQSWQPHRPIFLEATQLFPKGLSFADRVVSLSPLLSPHLLFLLHNLEACGEYNKQQEAGEISVVSNADSASGSGSGTCIN